MEKTIIPFGKWLIGFDTECIFCQSSVRFVLKRDKKSRFLYTSLMSDISNQVRNTHPEVAIPDSIYLFTGKQLYFKSDAALRIAGQLVFPWNLVTVFLIVPRVIRDYFYVLIAKYRYKFIPENKSCPVPTPTLKERIL